MSDEHGAPIRHVHRSCGHTMHGVLVCSECGEPLQATEVRLEEAPAYAGQLLPAHWKDRD